MKKMVIAIVLAALLLILLFPIKLGVNDGGSTLYKALLYEVWDVHRMSGSTADGVSAYVDGWIISVLGTEVYNSVE